MVHEPVPCPRCAEPTPPTREACEHCERPLAPTAGHDAGPEQYVLAYSVLATALATVLALAIGLVLFVVTPRGPVVVLAPAAACLAATLAGLAIYRHGYRGDRA